MIFGSPTRTVKSESLSLYLSLYLGIQGAAWFSDLIPVVAAAGRPAVRALERECDRIRADGLLDELLLFPLVNAQEPGRRGGGRRPAGVLDSFHRTSAQLSDGGAEAGRDVVVRSHVHRFLLTPHHLCICNHRLISHQSESIKILFQIDPQLVLFMLIVHPFESYNDPLTIFGESEQ